MKNACVIGWPISHSRSPLIHGYWLKTLGIDGSYEKRLVEPGRLEDFARSMAAGSYLGCNVTLPHKEAMARLVDHLDDRSRQAGSVNTVYVRRGELYATSTDGIGFCQNVQSHHPEFDFQDAIVTILGAGGSARAILDEIIRRGARQVRIANRSMDRAAALAAPYGAKAVTIPLADGPLRVSDCDLLVNTTSLGMQGQPQLDFSFDHVPTTTIIADIIYTPLKTRLITAAEARGNPVVPGLGMLLHQAVRGFELWFGQTPEVTPDLHDLVARDIDPDFAP